MFLKLFPKIVIIFSTLQFHCEFQIFNCGQVQINRGIGALKEKKNRHKFAIFLIDCNDMNNRKNDLSKCDF